MLFVVFWKYDPWTVMVYGMASRMTAGATAVMFWGSAAPATVANVANNRIMHRSSILAAFAVFLCKLSSGLRFG